MRYVGMGVLYIMKQIIHQTTPTIIVLIMKINKLLSELIQVVRHIII